jgi:DNA helicase-2/ATP-dependent DNA helicase PcrA
MEDALRTAGIPYQVARGTAFFDRKEIKDAVAYLRTIANPADEINLARIINTPARGISETTVKALQVAAVSEHRPLSDVVRDPSRVASLNTRALTALGKFATLLDAWRAALGPSDANPLGLLPAEAAEAQTAGDGSLRGFVERVLRESGLEEHYTNDKSDTEGERIANLGELISSAQQFEEELGEDAGELDLGGKLQAYLERISLISDVDTVSPDQGAVTLMTLHAAKGLEFPVVAMIGLEDGLLPHQRANHTLHELEEERRLCFVGITRAQRKLLLTHARLRTVFGMVTPTIPSRFLGELPAEAIEEQDVSEEETESFTDGDERFAEATAQRHAARELLGQYRPGDMVRHPKFGLGRVLTVTAAGAQTRAQVAFNTSGVKTLVLQYAQLERVSR